MTRTWTDDDILRDDSKAFEALLKRVNASVTKLGLERTEAARTNRDGWPVYGPEERQARETTARAEFDAALAEEEQACAEQVARFEREVETLAASQQNPLSRLDTESLTRASAMRSFVEADVRRLSARDLVDQVDAVVAAGDRGAMAAWHHVLIQRAGEVQDEAQLVLLQAAVDKLAEGLQDTTLAKRQKAVAKRLELARKARQDMWDAVRSVRVSHMQAEMAASGRYSL